jgi:hypothetical protein
MKKTSLFIILAAASFAVAAQQQTQRSAGTEEQQTRGGQASQGADSSTDRTIVERARADGSAGGTAPVPPEKRKAVGAGAGPHLKDHRLGMGQDVGRDQPVEPSK